MLLDIVMGVILLLLMIVGIKRGIARTLYAFLSVAVSAVVSYLTSRVIAKWIFDSFIATSVEKGITESAAEVSSSTQMNLPDFISGLLSFFGISGDSVQSSVQSAADSSAEVVSSAVNNTLAPIVTTVLGVVFMILLFIIMTLIFKLLGGAILQLFELPVIKGLNAVLGGALGLCEGVIICYLLILICKIALPYVSEPFISPELIDSSYVFKIIYNSDLMNNISGVMNSGNEAAVVSATEAMTEAVR